VSKTGIQAGITNRPPEHALFALLKFAEPTKAGVLAAIDALREVVKAELHSELDEEALESGELGFEDHYDRAHLTITLGLASSTFGYLGTSEAPSDLRPIPWSELVDSPPEPEDSGDLLLQICADNLYVCEHVLRRVEHDLGSQLQTVATFVGSQRYTSRAGRTSRREGRALIGFLDGISNLDPRSDEDDEKLVFVDPAPEAFDDYPPKEPPITETYGQGRPSFPPDLAEPPASEPEWSLDGTYMTLRVSTFPAAVWDGHPEAEQQQAVGRFKRYGGPLDREDTEAGLEAVPAFAENKADEEVAIDAHIRKANPRGGPEDEKRRIFRRGYPLIASGPAGLERGLIFVSFARTITTQFEFIVRGWIRNVNFPREGAGADKLLDQALLAETILGGGYYFVPGLEKKTEPWTWKLPAD
jgi:Dyp-type peroxidase family